MSTSSPTPESQALAQRARRGPRLANDPDRYIRQVKGGRYQVRPYCDIEKERYVVPGTFATKHAARVALQRFWQGKVKEVTKYVRPFRHPDGTTSYQVIITVNGGHYPTEAAAENARNWLLSGLFGDAAAVMAKRHEFARKSTPPPVEDTGA